MSCLDVAVSRVEWLNEDMEPKPFVEFYDPKMTDRQLTLLLLYEVMELKAEIRAVSNVLLTAHKTSVSTETFSKMTDVAQDAAIQELWEHARQIIHGHQKPPLN